MRSHHYERKLTNIERLFTYSPFSTVSLVARIKGPLQKEELVNSISKVKSKYSLLRTKIIHKENDGPWFSSEQVGEIPVELIRRNSDNQWMNVIENRSKIPFEFDKRPPIRFLLVQSPTESELIVLCHHIICDGLSLAYLLRDLMISLADSSNVFKVLPKSMPINSKNIPPKVSLNWFYRYVINRINRKWKAEKIIFNQRDYLLINEAYWKKFNHKATSLELSEIQTTNFIDRCKKEKVSVNSLLTIVFMEGQIAVRGYESSLSSNGIAANLRKRLTIKVGESMGFYAGMLRLKYKYEIRKSIWENARQFQKKFKSELNDRNLFKDFLSWLALDPSIIEAINFKKIGGLVNVNTEAGKRLNAYSKKKDVVLSILKRDKMDSFEHKILGTAVTNLTKLDFPRKYGKFELDRLLLHPGGAFPLVNVNLVLGAVTCSGKLSIIIEYAEETIDSVSIKKIKERVLMFLLAGDL